MLDALRAERDAAPVLPGLDSDTYARDHAAFEDRSDQRRLISEYLTRRLAEHRTESLSVLSVGCGDGTLDSSLAAGLTDDTGRRLRYVGVDPYETGTTSFARRMLELDAPGLSVETHSTTWQDADVTGTFDVITFVHSMYYVPDVAAAVRKALSLLAPGGELLVLSGPRAEMNTLVGICAPALDGHLQWFSDDVAVGIAEAADPRDHDVQPIHTLEALFALEPVTPDILDFTVQARLTPAARELVTAYLGSVSVSDPVTGAPRVPHPVDVHRVRSTG